QLGQVIGREAEVGAEAAHRGGWAAGQVVGYPAKPRQRTELNRGTEPVLHTDFAAQPCSVVAGERKERHQVVIGDLVGPATQPRELGVGQEPNRHAARYPRLPVPDKTVAGWRPLKEPQTDRTKHRASEVPVLAVVNALRPATTANACRWFMTMTSALPQPLDHPARSPGGDRRFQARPQSST